jgi:hypothetical protein
MKGYTMKKILLITLLLLTLTLTACGSASNTDQVSSTQESATLPTATQLAVGTLKLDGTEQAVTANQANELLVMWQVYQDLSSSDTAAQEEIDGLVEQIQETMTTDQTNAIKAMNLTQQDVFALMQEQSGDFTQARQSSSSSNSMQSGGGFAPPDGGMAGGPPDGGSLPGGAPPDGGIGGMGSAGSSTSTGQTQATGTGAGAGGSAGVPTPLVSALIQYLQQIASA